MGITPHSIGVHKVLKHLRPLLNPLLDAPSKYRLANAVNIADLRECAKQRSHRMVFDYMDGCAEDEIAFRWSRESYAQYEMHYNVLAGTKQPIDMRTTILGAKVDVPFFCCPCAGQGMFHHEGENATAAAASKHGALFCLSSLTTTSIEEVAAQHAGPKLFQLYLWKDRALVRDVVQRAKEAGYHSLALTADTAWFGNRERDPRNGFSVPPKYTPRQVWHALNAPSWSFDFLSHEPCVPSRTTRTRTRARHARHARRFAPHARSSTAQHHSPSHSARQVQVCARGRRQACRRHRLLLCRPRVQGLLMGRCRVAAGRVERPNAAQGRRAPRRRRARAPRGLRRRVDIEPRRPSARDLARAARCAAEHPRASRPRRDHHPGRRRAGRARDPLTASLAQPPLLPPRVLTAARAQRGTDVVKALALGADAVGLGKAYLYGLAAGGTAGAMKALDIVHRETELAMGLLGVHDVAELKARGPDLVQRRSARSSAGGR